MMIWWDLIIFLMNEITYNGRLSSRTVRVDGAMRVDCWLMVVVPFQARKEKTGWDGADFSASRPLGPFTTGHLLRRAVSICISIYIHMDTRRCCMLLNICSFFFLGGGLLFLRQHCSSRSICQQLDQQPARSCGTWCPAPLHVHSQIHIGNLYTRNDHHDPPLDPNLPAGRAQLSLYKYRQ